MVKYRILNGDTRRHTVGAAALLNIAIGQNNGPSFYVPPTQGKLARLVAGYELIVRKDMPDFISALEVADLNDPNSTLATLGLKVYPGELLESLVIQAVPDSSVALQWERRALQPGEERTLVFTYGLGRVCRGNECVCCGSPAVGRMQLVGDNVARVHEPFRVTAYFQVSWSTQSVSLKLPAHLELLPGQHAEQIVPPPGPEGYSRIVWLVRSKLAGLYQVQVEAPTIGVERQWVRLDD